MAKIKTKGRRVKGEGSITERADGTWTARLDLGLKHDGKRNIKAFYGKSRTEVKKKMDEFQKHYQANTVDFHKQTVEEYMMNWLVTYKQAELKPSSFDTLESTIKNQVIANIGFVQLNNLAPDIVQAMLNKLAEKGLSRSTVSKVYKAMKSCFRNVVAKGQMNRDPMLEVIMPKNVVEESEKIKFLGESDIKLLYHAGMHIDSNGQLDFRYGPHLVLIMYTGLRVGEALALTWNDIDLEKKILNVNFSIKRVIDRSKPKTENGKQPYKWQQTLPKTKTSKRVIPLCPQAIEVLSFLKVYNKPESANEPIFAMVHENKNRIGDTTLTQHLQYMLFSINADNQDIGVHGLRHTFATMLFNAKVDIKTISKLLGHANIEITYDIYVHVVKELEQSAIATLENLT